jgi:hypothetical protein
MGALVLLLQYLVLLPHMPEAGVVLLIKVEREHHKALVVLAVAVMGGLMVLQTQVGAAGVVLPIFNQVVQVALEL